MQETQPNHCFPLNGNYESPEIYKITGIVQQYNDVLEEITMAGPTFFSSVMDMLNDLSQEGNILKTYFILLILTDGEIHDLVETKRMIVEASHYPCSVIIVGVGQEDFEKMVELDSDDRLLRDDRNNIAKRDIVQFVRFEEALARGNLAEEVLKEIPTQFCRYMEQIAFVPKKLEADMAQVNTELRK